VAEAEAGIVGLAVVVPVRDREPLRGERVTRRC
jgi:hypothetical protein